MRRKALESTTELRRVMNAYYGELATAARDGSAPVAWCTSVGPAELLYALGFRVFFPENHAAALGASRIANRCMARAHAKGYSQEICSYLTSDIGAYLGGESAFAAQGLEAVPRADVLVFNTNQCRDVRDWFEFYGREWGVPVLGVTSIRMVDDVTEGHVDAVATQIESLVSPLESIAGTRLSPALETAMRASAECTRLWKACLETATHRPSPFTFFDGTTQMGPAVVLRGRREACSYYETLLAELETRVRDGVGAVEGEQYRLYWDGMPMWGKLREHSEFFAELATCVVASTYCNSWIFDTLDPSDPFRSMARASLELFIARCDGPKERYIERMVRDFGADGVVFHDSRTCPNNSNARYGMPLRLQERLGVSVLTVEGDQNDLRCYSAEQSRTSIEGFVEQLAEQTAGSG